MGRKYTGDRARLVWDKQHGRWVIETYRDGRRIRSACPKECSKADALRRLQRTTNDLKAGRLDAPDTWEEVVEAFKAYRARKGDGEAGLVTLSYRLGAVAKTLGDRDPLALIVRDAEVHVEARQAEGRSPVTIKAELDAVTEMQRWALENGWCAAATWAKATRPNRAGVPPKEHLLPSEVGPFLRAAVALAAEVPEDAWNYLAWYRWPAAAVLLLEGPRTGEMRRLRVRHFDFGHEGMVIVYVRTTPTGRTKTRSSERPVVITSAVGCRILREAFEGRPLDEVCFSSITHPGRELPVKTKWFYERAIETCERAGVRRVATHGLRHSTGTLLCALPGIDKGGAADALGHADTRTTDQYSHAAVGKRLPTALVYGQAIDDAFEGKPMFRVIKGGREEVAVVPSRKRQA